MRMTYAMTRRLPKMPHMRVLDGGFFCNKGPLLKGKRLFNGVLAWFLDTRLKHNGCWRMARFSWITWNYKEELALCGSSGPLCWVFEDVFLERSLEAAFRETTSRWLSPMFEFCNGLTLIIEFLEWYTPDWPSFGGLDSRCSLWWLIIVLVLKRFALD